MPFQHVRCLQPLLRYEHFNVRMVDEIEEEEIGWACVTHGTEK